MSRLQLLPLLLFVVAVVAFGAAPSVAAEPDSPACGIDVSTLLAQAPVEPAASAATFARPDAAPVVPAPSFLATYRGYCRCSCSLIKNCNTSADCGGSACLGGVSCC